MSKMMPFPHRACSPNVETKNSRDVLIQRSGEQHWNDCRECTSVVLAYILIAPQVILTNVLIWTRNYMTTLAMAGGEGDYFRKHTGEFEE